MTQGTQTGRGSVHVTAATGDTSIGLTFHGEPSEATFAAIITGLKQEGFNPKQARMIEGDQVLLPVNMPEGRTVDETTLEKVDTVLSNAFSVRATGDIAA